MKEIEKFFLELQRKYEYSDQLIENLKLLIPVLIMYYGVNKKDIIMKALQNCEIHFQQKGENEKDFLNKYFNNDKEYKIPDLGGSFYHSEILIDDNKIKTKDIIYIKQEHFDLYKPFNFSNPNSLSSLIHEICHLIKSHQRIKVENNQIVQYSGLSKETFDYDQSNNQLKMSESLYSGFEEALNSHDEAQIMSLMTNQDHKYGSYKELSYMASKLLENSLISSEIKESQFHGGPKWFNLLGEDGPAMLENFETVLDLMYVPIGDIANSEKLAQYQTKKQAALSEIMQSIENINYDLSNKARLR